MIMKTINKMEKTKDTDLMILLIIIHIKIEDQEMTETLNLIIVDQVQDMIILMKMIVKYFYFR